ncbi:MAG: hypothetical protein GWO04_24840, partial [Actinobacteria bacterium]|nr:hypothetical protein [Actinomycetota bacterium]
MSPIEELDTNASQPVLPRIAWTGSEFGVAWNGGDIQLQLADVGGTPIGGRSAIEANSDGLDMVHTGAAYAFISVDNDEVRFNLGTPGTFADPSPVLHVGENDLQYPAVRETETGFFAAWADENGRLVNTAVLDERGNLVGTPQPLVVPMMRERLDARP